MVAWQLGELSMVATAAQESQGQLQDLIDALNRRLDGQGVHGQEGQQEQDGDCAEGQQLSHGQGQLPYREEVWVTTEEQPLQRIQGHEEAGACMEQNSIRSQAGECVWYRLTSDEEQVPMPVQYHIDPWYYWYTAPGYFGFGHANEGSGSHDCKKGQDAFQGLQHQCGAELH